MYELRCAATYMPYSPSPDTVNPVHDLQVYTFWIYQHLVNLGSYELDLSVYR